MTRRRTAFIIACAVLAALGPVRAADEHGVMLQTNVPVKMRDGVTLYADVYRPKDDGSIRCSLQRTPYNKDGDREFGLRAAARGYVVIIQDVRGRYTSEGEWYTFKHEPDDGTTRWSGRARCRIGWQGRDVRRLVCRRDADARGHRPSASPRRDLSRRHGEQLPLELDVSGRRVLAVVQSVVDVRAGAGHHRPQHARQEQRAQGHDAVAARQLSAVQSAG